MSAQDLEQRALELLPELPPMAMTVAGDDPDAGHWYRAEQMRDYAAYDPNCGARTVRVVDGALLRWVKAQADDENANPRFRELYDALAQGVQS